MSRMNDGDWRERVSDVREGRASSKSKNDRVADLWGRNGWGDDDGWGEDEEAEGLGQRPGAKSRSRNHYRRERQEADRMRPRALGMNTAQRAITAHGMVQSFVSTFSSEHGAYRVVFSLNTPAPAATIFEQHLVLVDPSPIFDRTISAQTCGLVMTALSVHEVSHIEFDRHHGDAVAAAVTRNKALALRISNILSDRRIERRFAARYPGYADVFEPALEYICRDFHGRAITFDPKDPGNLVVAAVRYAKWLDWSAPGMAAEQAWWDDLAERAAQSDDVDWHVAHVIEGLKRLQRMVKNAPAAPPPITCGPTGKSPEPPSPTVEEDEDGNKLTPHPFKA